MQIAIRKEPNGSMYIDKNIYNDNRFAEKTLSQPPYNFTKVEIDNKYSDCVGADFNDDLTFNIIKYQSRLRNEEINIKINELKIKLAKLDYIGVKIATGRGTREEYAREIELMTFYANEINNLEKKLTQLS